MKTIRLPLIALVGLALAGSARAAAPGDTAAPSVDVTYVNPEHFTDIKDAFMPTDKGQAAILDDLKDYLVQQISRRLAPGQHVAITVTDIDLAGNYEPWHGPQAQDIRFIKDIYPPRVTLSFKLTDADGKVVKEGDRRLSNNAFMMTAGFVGRSDERYYDKELLSDWIRDDFPRANKS